MLRCSNAKMKKNGFTLLEVMIAIFLVIVGITGVFLLITKTVGQMALSSSRLIAAYLSQEGIEIVRNIRDTNWLEQSYHANSWDEGLVLPDIDCSAGCEADYTDTTVENPTLSTYDGGNFLNIDGNGFYSYSPGTATKFKRKITIDTGTPDILEVTVLVEWQEKGKSYQHSAQENLYNWK